jgi:Ricin-type beta-trefoil lectin domain-like
VTNKTNRTAGVARLWALSTCLLAAACAAPDDDASALSDSADPEADLALSTSELQSENGLQGINGLAVRNGLTENGLAVRNGLRLSTGLSSTTGLMTTAAGRETVKYLVRCALSASQSLVKKDQYGVSYTFKGAIGIAPEWADGTCDLNCQESVSACLLAHVNTSGQRISLWLDGNMPGVGWGQSTGFPYEEGSFFGNLFVSPPKAYYCNGKDFDQGVVPGRLGADQTNAPYTNPWGQGAACKNYCTAMDIPYQSDGYKACFGLNHVVTVWRNFDPATAYKICNRQSGKCLDAGSGSEGANVVQSGYASKNSQKWSIVQVSPKQYKVVNVQSGKALTVNKGLTADGTAVVQSSFGGATHQLWSFTSMGNATGYHALSPVSNIQSVLAPPSASANQEGQALQEWKWSPTVSSMQWTIAIAK